MSDADKARTTEKPQRDVEFRKGGQTFEPSTQERPKPPSGSMPPKKETKANR